MSRSSYWFLLIHVNSFPSLQRYSYLALAQWCGKDKSNWDMAVCYLLSSSMFLAYSSVDKFCGCEIVWKIRLLLARMGSHFDWKGYQCFIFILFIILSLAWNIRSFTLLSDCHLCQAIIKAIMNIDNFLWGLLLCQCLLIFCSLVQSLIVLVNLFGIERRIFK